MLIACYWFMNTPCTIHLCVWYTNVRLFSLLDLKPFLRRDCPNLRTLQTPLNTNTAWNRLAQHYYSHGPALRKQEFLAYCSFIFTYVPMFTCVSMVLKRYISENISAHSNQFWKSQHNRTIFKNLSTLEPFFNISAHSHMCDCESSTICLYRFRTILLDFNHAQKLCALTSCSIMRTQTSRTYQAVPLVPPWSPRARFVTRNFSNKFTLPLLPFPDASRSTVPSNSSLSLTRKSNEARCDRHNP